MLKITQFVDSCKNFWKKRKKKKKSVYFRRTRSNDPHKLEEKKSNTKTSYFYKISYLLRAPFDKHLYYMVKNFKPIYSINNILIFTDIP